MYAFVKTCRSHLGHISTHFKCERFIALVYSTAEHCVPVWSCSAHAKMLDISINSSLRTIPASDLPLLTFNVPAHLRHDTATIQLAKKYSRPDYLLKHFLKHSATKRMKFRHPFTRVSSDLMDSLKQNETTSSWIH